jgi:hypothetical protein
MRYCCCETLEEFGKGIFQSGSNSVGLESPSRTRASRHRSRTCSRIFRIADYGKSRPWADRIPGSGYANSAQSYFMSFHAGPPALSSECACSGLTRTCFQRVSPTQELTDCPAVTGRLCARRNPTSMPVTTAECAQAKPRGQIHRRSSSRSLQLKDLEISFTKHNKTADRIAKRHLRTPLTGNGPKPSTLITPRSPVA